MHKKICLGCLLIACYLFACDSGGKMDKLPYIGERTLSSSGDTIYHKVPDFSFVDQDSQVVNNATFQGKIYVVDFFFIHCPTICPKVTANCLRINERFKNDPRVCLIAHTVDVRNDTVAALRSHAHKIGITDNKKWHFVTGDKDAVYGIADEYYLVNPSEDADSPGGFNHDGRLVLVDSNRHVRAYCDGTNDASVDQFMEKIETLLATEFPTQKR
jgi:protein SCO1